MSTIVFLIEQTAPGLYIFIVLGIWRYGWEWRAARHTYRSTSFRLEQDLARDRIGGALTAMVLLLEAGLFVAGIEGVVAPTVREDRAARGITIISRGRPDDGDFRTPTAPPPGGTPALEVGDYNLGGLEEAEIFLTPTPIPTPVGTIDPAAPPSGCLNDFAMLQIPANGMRVFQTIRVVGTAYTEHFSAYQLQLSGPGTLNQFVTLDEGTIPLEEVGTLSQFNPTPYEPGTYKFRLMVFDTTTVLRAHCEITIYISEPIPTPTPF